MRNQKQLKALLDEKAVLFNRPEFIKDDPISIPHRFQKMQDIEIAGFFAAIFAWGQRKTIINKSLDLMDRMDNAPHEFILNHNENDLKKILGFKHRTFNDTDLLYFIHFLNHYYHQSDSLEDAFLLKDQETNMGNALKRFHQRFFSLEDAPRRTQKHIATPARQSSCKRLNMYLRWMVRKDNNGVDFGLWKKISSKSLLCPLDVHVERVAVELGLLQKPGSNWKATLELTENLRKLDPSDPVKYDFALFGMGVIQKKTF